MTIKEELIQYLETIQQFDKDSCQDGDILHSYMIELTNILGRSNFLMADLKRKFREDKKEAYLKLANSRIADQKYYSVSLAKDYIDSLCSESGFMYELAERLSRTIVHVLDTLRTIVSSLKSERQFASYQQ